MTQLIVTADSKKPLSELWERRALVYFFVWRDLKGRYRRSFLGISWVLIQPLLLAGIFALIGAHRTGLADYPSEIPVFLIVFLAISLWQYFENCLTGATNSIGSNYHLLKKVYVPKPLLLLSVVASRAVDFLLTLLVFALLLLVTGSEMSLVGLALCFVAAAVLAVLALTVALILAPLSVIYHDVSLALPFVMRVMFFATPLWYSLAILPEKVQALLMLSPVVTMIEMVKRPFAGLPLLEFQVIWPSLIVIIILLPFGVWIFRQMESSLVDHL